MIQPNADEIVDGGRVQVLFELAQQVRLGHGRKLAKVIQADRISIVTVNIMFQ